MRFTRLKRVRGNLLEAQLPVSAAEAPATIGVCLWLQGACCLYGCTVQQNSEASSSTQRTCNPRPASPTHGEK
eukprot:1657802-Amphidinium_carterae.1